MKKKKTKTKDVLARALAANSREEAEAMLEEEYSNKPIYTVLNIFIGGRNNVKKVKSDVKGKPNNPPY